jgi:hypothetical protein
MSLLLVAALVCAPAQIGEQSKVGFLVLLTEMGYQTFNLKDPYLAKLSDASTSIHVSVSFASHGKSTEAFVGSASGRVEFDLPRALPKKGLLDWQAREKLERVKVHSFLGGRVVLEGHLASPADSLEEVKANVERLLEACRKLRREVAALGGKQSDSVYQMGKAQLNLNDKLEDVDPEDLDYLREKLNWGSKQTPGGGKGWSTGAEPLGMPMIFSGMKAWKPGFFLTCMGHADEKKLQRWGATVGASIKWAQVTVQAGSFHIQKWVDTKGGLTVRQIRDEILDFARRVKALGLPSA